jgi:hypothetical protein
MARSIQPLHSSWCYTKSYDLQNASDMAPKCSNTLRSPLKRFEPLRAVSYSIIPIWPPSPRLGCFWVPSTHCLHIDQTCVGHTHHTLTKCVPVSDDMRCLCDVGVIATTRAAACFDILDSGHLFLVSFLIYFSFRTLFPLSSCFPHVCLMANYLFRNYLIFSL